MGSGSDHDAPDDAALDSHDDVVDCLDGLAVVVEPGHG